jgi:hypothetical protein
VVVIQSIGYTQDGGTWISLVAEVERDEIAKNENKTVQLTVIVPMDDEKSLEIRDAINYAIECGKKWRETGVDPNVGKTS